jgi:hypothetical protein
MIMWPTTHLNANMSDAEFEHMIRTSLTPQRSFRDVNEFVISGMSLRSDTKRVQEALQTRGDDLRPKMVYATLTERPPPVGSPLHTALELLGKKHNTAGVICGTFADDTIGEQRMRPLPTLPGMPRVVQVDVRRTSWGEGRNRLLQVAQEAFPDFEYIALADDDVLFSLRCCHALPSVPCDTLLEEFQTKQATPVAVSAQQLCVADLERHIGVVRPHFVGLFRTWVEHESPLVEAAMKQASKEGGSMYQSMNWPFPDAILNIFSREAIEVDNIIPYDTEIEKLSWWMSQAVVNLRLLCKYGRSDSVMTSAAIAPYNPLHRPYPKGLKLAHSHYAQAVLDRQDPVKCPMKLNAGRP